MRTVHSPLLSLAMLPLVGGAVDAADRPNILWLITEDFGPELACSGSARVTNPNRDGSTDGRFSDPGRRHLEAHLFPSMLGVPRIDAFREAGSILYRATPVKGNVHNLCRIYSERT